MHSLQEGNPHLSESAVPQSHPEAMQSPTSEAGTPRAVAALPPTHALPASVTTTGISHASEAGRAAEPERVRQAHSAATGHADGTQGKADGVVVVTLLSVDIVPTTSREGR